MNKAVTPRREPTAGSEIGIGASTNSPFVPFSWPATGGCDASIGFMGSASEMSGGDSAGVVAVRTVRDPAAPAGAGVGVGVAAGGSGGAGCATAATAASATDTTRRSTLTHTADS